MEGECKTAVESLSVRLPARESSSASPRVNHGSVQLLLQNHANFKLSAAPHRLMYSSGEGKWQDCPGEVVESLNVAFAEGKTVADASIDGVSYLFDLLRMLQVDLESGAQRSIAWIDVKGKCFFPQVCVCEEMEGECKTAVESPTVRLPARESTSSSPRVNHGSVQLLLQNHANFKLSAAPLRFMYSSGDGKWEDCPGEVVESLKVAFAEGKTFADASIGGVSYLFDLLRMLQVDLESGAQRSIAWIDVKGKCFFPKVCVCEDGDDDLQEPEVQSIKIEVMVDGNSTKAQQMEGVPQEAEVSSTKKEDDNDFEGSKRQDFVNLPEVETSRWPSTRLLPEGEIVFSMYKDFFLSGMRGVDPGVTITAIYQCTRVGPLEKARYEVFEKQIELTRALRGSCNIVYAWHGASAKVVDNILAYGFGVHGKNSAGVEPYRSGILLSPLTLPFESAKLAEADSKGEKHVLLCKVILGNVEKVELRSKQLYPSTVHYDNGADDPRNPKWYTVWSSNMNSHIIPECVLSFKLSNSVQGHVRSLTSLRYSLQELCKKIRNLLPPSKCQEVETLYNASKDGKLAKNILIRRLRQVAGDEVLKTAIQELRGLP